MPQLPTPAASGDIWGNTLNTFLTTAHDNTATDGGKLKPDLGSIVAGGKVGIRVSDPVIDLAIGDSDTGLNQEGDGNLMIKTNGNNSINVRPNGSIQIANKIGLQNYNADSGYPAEIAGGAHLYDTYVEGGHYVGRGGMLVVSMNQPVNQPYGLFLVYADGNDRNTVECEINGNRGTEVGLYVKRKILCDRDIAALAFNTTSDERLKTNITNLSSRDSLEKIKMLNAKSFNWKDDEVNEKAGKQIGFIAQEVEKIYPEVVNTDDKGIKSVSYSSLVAPLVEAIKEQQSMIDDLKREIAELKTKI